MDPFVLDTFKKVPLEIWLEITIFFFSFFFNFYLLFNGHLIKLQLTSRCIISMLEAPDVYESF